VSVESAFNFNLQSKVSEFDYVVKCQLKKIWFFDANNLILEFKLTNTNISYKWYPKQLMSISPPLRYNSSPMIRPRIFPIVYFELSEWICSSFLFNCGKHIFFANSRFYISKFPTNTSGNFNTQKGRCEHNNRDTDFWLP
jgi:hypothetical protein